jgi:hypothetical protein
MTAPAPFPLGRLRRLAVPKPASPPEPGEGSQLRCELCSAPLAEDHRHLLDLEARAPLCACRACSLLFDRKTTGGKHYRLIPDRVWELTDFRLDDAVWDALRIPVSMAFLFQSSAADRVVAFYPGPMGAIESLLALETWGDVVRANPVLQQLEPDVEALLINRTGDAHAYWLAPVDLCYDLVGLIRQNWKGLAGGQEVWEKLDGFFGAVQERARPVTRDGRPLRRQAQGG